MLETEGKLGSEVIEAAGNSYPGEALRPVVSEASHALSPGKRRSIRILAARLGVPFSQALNLDVRVRRELGRDFNSSRAEELRVRVKETQGILQCSFPEAIEVFFADPGSEGKLERARPIRTCNQPKCAFPIAPWSYYRCKRHPLTLESDPGDWVYLASAWGDGEESENCIETSTVSET